MRIWGCCGYNSEQFRYISHVSQLGATLLSDHVFAQQPKLAKTLALRITSSPRFNLLLAPRYIHADDRPLVLPEGPARDALVQACKDFVSQLNQSDLRYAAARTLLANCTKKELLDFWRSLEKSSNGREWTSAGSSLNVLQQLPLEECRSIVRSVGKACAWEFMVSGRIDVLEAEPELLWALVDHLLELGGGFFGSGVSNSNVTSGLYIFFQYLSAILGTQMYADSLDTVERFSLAQLFARNWRELPAFAIDKVIHDCVQEPIGGRQISKSLIDSMGRLITSEREDLVSDLSIWSDFIEEVRTEWGDMWGLNWLIELAIDFVKPEQIPVCDLADVNESLCTRAGRARLFADEVAWWTKQIDSASNSAPPMKGFIVISLFIWGSFESILLNHVKLSVIIEGMNQNHWSLLARNLLLARASRRHRKVKRDTQMSCECPGELSPRVAALVAGRLETPAARIFCQQYLANYLGDDYWILRVMIENAVNEASERAEEWPRAVQLIARGHALGFVNPNAIHDSRRQKDNFPIAEAKLVCGNANAYPLTLVSRADAVLTAQAGAEAISVGKIAARDDWFVATQ